MKVNTKQKKSGSQDENVQLRINCERTGVAYRKRKERTEKAKKYKNKKEAEKRTEREYRKREKRRRSNRRENRKYHCWILTKKKGYKENMQEQTRQ